MNNPVYVIAERALFYKGMAVWFWHFWVQQCFVEAINFNLIIEVEAGVTSFYGWDIFSGKIFAMSLYWMECIRAKFLII
jgi:hypothetical protein